MIPRTIEELEAEIDRLYGWRMAISFGEINKPQRTIDKIDAIAKRCCEAQIARYWMERIT
jgi:hypothetical protein